MTAITDYFGKSSIPTAYAVATTVKTTRNSGVTVLEAIDMSKYAQDTPIYFVTYKKTTDPVTGIASVTNLVSWKGLVNVSANTITNLTLAPGYTDLGNAVGDFIECIPTSYWENSLMDGIFVGHNPDGTFKKSALQAALGNDGNLVSSLDDLTSDVILSGGIWSIVSGLNATMTALTGYIDGYKNTVAAVATRAFTINKDIYVDVLRNTTTNAFSLVYTEVANGATTGFTLAANSIRLAKVVTNGTAITSVTQYGTDSLNTIIYPTLLKMPATYGQQELPTSEVWIDGKPVYRQTFSNAIIASGSEQLVTVGLTTAVARIIKLEGGLSTTPSGGNYDYYPLEYMNPAATTLQNMQLKLSYVSTGTPHWEVRCNAGTSGTLTITVYYTK